MNNDLNYNMNGMNDLNNMYGAQPYNAPIPGMYEGMPMAQSPYMQSGPMYGMDYGDYDDMGYNMMPPMSPMQYNSYELHMNRYENERMCPYVSGMMCPYCELKEEKDKKKRIRKDSEKDED